MPVYSAFLRAINVGGHTLKMDALRKLFESLGFSDVQTFIASGNVLFTTEDPDRRALEQKIEQHLKSSLGYEVPTFIRTSAELTAIARYTAFPQPQIEAAEALNVAFLAETLEEPLIIKLMALKTEIDDFHVHQREIYWLCNRKQSESTFSNNLLEKTIGRKSTLRGINTIRRMAEKFPTSHE